MATAPKLDVSEGASFPTMREEIDRKGLDYIEATEHRYSIGLLSDAERNQRIHAVWDLLSGLAGDWLFEYFSMAQPKESGPSFVERRIFTNGNQAAVVSWEVRSAIVKFLLLSDNTQKEFNFKDEIFPAVAAKAKVEDLANKLRSKGWLEL